MEQSFNSWPWINQDDRGLQMRMLILFREPGVPTKPCHNLKLLEATPSKTIVGHSFLPFNCPLHACEQFFHSQCIPPRLPLQPGNPLYSYSATIVLRSLGLGEQSLRFYSRMIYQYRPSSVIARKFSLPSLGLHQHYRLCSLVLAVKEPRWPSEWLRVLGDQCNPISVKCQWPICSQTQRGALTGPWVQYASWFWRWSHILRKSGWLIWNHILKTLEGYTGSSAKH